MEFHSFIEKLSRQKLSVDFLFRHSTAYEVSSYFLKNEMLPKSDISDVYQPSMMSEGSPIIVSSIAFKFPGGVQTLSDLSQAQFKKSNMSEKSDILFSPDDLKDFPSASYGCFIKDKYQFNAEFFGISTAEDSYMDPNQRLLLEVVARAIYNTGRKLDDVKDKKIGVWVAMSNSDYHLLDGKGFKGDSSTFSATSTALAMCAGRISFSLGLHGPSVVVDTACSSSLVAIHQACSSILAGECEEAIVAASNLILTPWVSLAYARAGMLSSKGKCMVFDEQSNGYCRGEGVCALILKKRVINPTLSVRSYATIKACQTMHHGRGASLTAPNSDAQKDLLQTVLRKANISIEEIDFIEAHGQKYMISFSLFCN
jgi:acyl transferase domain-containing protein